MNLDRTKNAISGTASGILSKMVSVVGSFAIQTIIIKVMGVEYAGLSSLFTSVLSILSLAELGFGSALVYSMYKPIAEGNLEHLNALLSYYKRIYNYVCIIVTAIGFALLPWIPYFIHGDYPSAINLYILYSIFLVNSISSYLPPAYRRSILYAYQRRDVDNNYTTLIKGIQFLFQAVILIIFKNYYFFALVFALSTIPVNFLVAVRTKKDYPDIKPVGSITEGEKQSIKQKVVALFGHQLGAKVIISSDSIIISSILGISTLGLYSNYYYIFYSIVETLEIIRLSLVAGVGNKLETSTTEESFSIFRVSIYLWMLIVGWAASCMLCMFQPFITLWMGEQYLLNQTTLYVIIAYFYFWQFRAILVVFKDAAGLWKEDKFKPYLGIVVNIFGSILLTLRLNSVIGVLIPTIIIMLFIYYPIESKVVFRCIYKNQAISKHFAFTFKLMAVNIFSVIISYLISSAIVIHSMLLYVVICFGIASCLSVGVFVLFTYKTNEFKHCVRIFRSLKAKVLNIMRRI